MKFSDIDKEQWPQLKPYLDTILLPVTGLNGSEEPWEAALGLEELRDLIDIAEGPFRGRIVVYPAYHYISESTLEDELQHICSRLRANGFVYVIIAIRGNIKLLTDKHYCDLLLSYSNYKGSTVGIMKKDVQEKIVSIWNAKLTHSNM
jgi:23S rRNA (pseudouridine1915-N3)-methyltransferase